MTTEQQARELISNTQLADLLDEWELTSKIKDKNIYTVRGWLMDEFEKRNPEGFEKWLDENGLDEELRNYITK